MKTFYALVTALVLSAVLHAQEVGKVDRLMPTLLVNGRPMDVQRVLERGQLEVIVSRWSEQWTKAGPVRREQSGEWMVLSRPGPRGFEVFQFRQQGEFVEALSSAVPYDAGRKHRIGDSPSGEGSSFFRALGFLPKGPLLEQSDGSRHAVTAVTQLAGPVDSNFHRLVKDAALAGWQKEFAHHDPKRGAVAFLGNGKGGKVQLTLHSHQGGTALVVSETKEEQKQ